MQLRPTPTLKQLRHLAALAEHRHFGKAAAACLITQASLSASIKELETILGRVLVERSKRHVRMTPLAEQVVARARRVLIEVEDIVDLVAAAGGPFTGTIRLGVIPTIAPFLLPRVLPAIRAAHPDLKLYLKEALSGVLVEDVSGGALDIALLAFPYDTGSLATHIFADDPFLLAYGPGAGLPEREHFLTRDVDRSRLLLLEEGHCLRDHVLASERRKTAGGERLMPATSLNTLVQMVDSDLGLTILPKLAIDGGITRGTRVEVRPLQGRGTSRRIGFAWRKTSPLAADYKSLADIFQNELATPLTPRQKGRKTAGR